MRTLNFPADNVLNFLITEWGRNIVYVHIISHMYVSCASGLAVFSIADSHIFLSMCSSCLL